MKKLQKMYKFSGDILRMRIRACHLHGGVGEGNSNLNSIEMEHSRGFILKLLKHGKLGEIKNYLSSWCLTI